MIPGGSMPILGNLKIVACAEVFLILFLSSLGFCADLTPLENKLLARDRAGVHIELQKLFREERDVFDKVVDSTDPVLDVFDAFDTLKAYHLSNNSPSEKLLIERFKSEWKKLPKKLPFNSDFVKAVNNVSKDFNEIIRQYNERVENAAEQRRLENENRRQALQREESERRQKEEEQRKQAELEQKLRLEKQEQERLQSEAIAKTQERERKEKEAAQQRKMEEKRLAIEKKTKAAGYRGLYDRGITRFLYKVKHGGNLKDGLGYVFWSDLSVNERKLDNKFEATQLVDGMIIYSLFEYAGDEAIDFTIMVPDNSGGIFLEGQTLRDSCHVYSGSGHLTTIFGVERTIPIFKAVNKEICH